MIYKYNVGESVKVISNELYLSEYVGTIHRVIQLSTAQKNALYLLDKIDQYGFYEYELVSVDRVKKLKRLLK